MALDNPRVYINQVGEYQASGVPWVTSSIITIGITKEITFPHVTRFFSVRNNTEDTAIAIAFTENGLKTVNSNYFILSGTESYSGELRVSKLFLSGAVGDSASFEIVAGLTRVPSAQLVITGSEGFEGVG